MNNHYYSGGPPSGGPGYRGAPPGPYPYPSPPPPGVYKRHVRRNANFIALGLILIYVVSYYAGGTIQQIFASLVSPQMQVELHPLFSQVLYLLTYVVGFMVPLFFMVIWIHIPRDVAFPMRVPKGNLAVPAIFFCQGLMVMGIFLSSMLSMFIEMFFGMSPTTSTFPVPHGFAAYVIYFISIAIAPAILEEMVFRGVIMQSLRRFGDGFALAVSAILFSLCHGNLVQAIPTLLLGLAIGYFVMRTGSLLTGMLIHFINNAMAVVMELVGYYTSPEVGNAFSLGVMAVYAVGGVIGLLFLLFKHPHMFRLVPSRYPLSEPQKHAAFYTAPLVLLYLAGTVVIMAKYLI